MSTSSRTAGGSTPYASDPRRPATSALTPWWRWLFLVPGLAAVGYGAFGLVGAGGRVPLLAWGTWFLGSALLHDLVIAPLWIGLGWLAARFLPRPARGPVVVAALVSGVLSLVALPFVLGFGGDPGDPSFLPRDYDRNLLLIVLAVWLVAAVWALVAVRRARRQGH
ncbi:hypothetical protein [Modestobacter roseus]|uniref:Transmembrane protein n=1 Tax=Modestobacter roseus TaxID=1181884 RepID=A0A562ILG0_9ACTN|nr:hypothetical protein [Modestobacter roseus]MQA32217.1 hypothetical protein [Modestobacter roseus]TWH71712.1 hypothetical protein JD78_00210 [Modestobacter roseus]